MGFMPRLGKREDSSFHIVISYTLWNIKTGALLRTLGEHEQAATALATGTPGGKVILWRLK